LEHCSSWEEKNSALKIPKISTDSIVEVEPKISKFANKSKTKATYDVDISTGICFFKTDLAVNCANTSKVSSCTAIYLLVKFFKKVGC